MTGAASPTRPWGGLLGRAVLLLAGSAVALVLLEVVLRVFNPFGQRLFGDAIVLPTNTRVVLRNADNPPADAPIPTT